MPEITPFLKSLLSTSGLSGFEGPASALIADAWRPLVDELSDGRLGSLHGLKRATTGVKKRPAILLAAHMDAIGLIVTSIQDGFLHVTGLGGIDARILPGCAVTVHGREDLPGVVVQPPARLLPASAGDGPVALEYLLVDTGLPARKVAQLVRTGDQVSFAGEPVDLAGETISGHSLDNRASVAALTVCLQELRERAHAWDVWAVATAQEEVGLFGAITSAYQIRPDAAIAIDVTFAKGPGSNDWGTFPLGKGPTLGWGPNLHPALHKALKDLADRLEIPVVTEVIPRHSGTDAFAIQVSAEGVPTALIGIPLRYMHTAVETVAIKDIQRAGRLMAEFIAGLAPDFIDQIVWEE